MALSSRVKNKIVDTMNVVFTSIGNANGMRMPKSENNHESLAWDYWRSKHVLSLAEKAKEAAEKACVVAGILPDKDKNPLPAGTREIVYNGDIVSIAVEVRNGSTRVDAKKLCELLAAKGVKQSLIDEALAASSTMSKPPHIFTPILITSDSIGK